MKYTNYEGKSRPQKTQLNFNSFDSSVTSSNEKLCFDSKMTFLRHGKFLLYSKCADLKKKPISSKNVF